MKKNMEPQFEFLMDLFQASVLGFSLGFSLGSSVGIKPTAPNDFASNS